jgi:hypothetical protein
MQTKPLYSTPIDLVRQVGSGLAGVKRIRHEGTDY